MQRSSTVPAILFFFSSRRRHTRWTGDWSSDVCSSDLYALCLLKGDIGGVIFDEQQGEGVCYAFQINLDGRSEERRVGKECRCRWWRYHSKKKKYTCMSLRRVQSYKRVRQHSGKAAHET